MVDFVIHLRTIRELIVDFLIQGEAHKAKRPKSLRLFGLGVCATRKLHPLILYNSVKKAWSFALLRITPNPESRRDGAKLPSYPAQPDSRTPPTLTFDEGQRDKTVQIALAWQNERGIIGQWSEYKSAIVP
jgi:hypothetical protein